MEVKVNGISFNAELCRKMKKKEFVEHHEKSFFLDKSKEDRCKILEDIYSIITGKPESQKE